MNEENSGEVNELFEYLMENFPVREMSENGTRFVWCETCKDITENLVWNEGEQPPLFLIQIVMTMHIVAKHPDKKILLH